MTLFFQEDEIDLLTARESRVMCTECGHRLASWLSRPYDPGNIFLIDEDETVFVNEKVPYCGWCLLYGSSQWSRDNAGEILYAGSYVKRVAETNLGKNTHVPELDARHRLNWHDSERYVMGILFSSRTISVSFARIGIIQKRLQDFYEESDGRQAGGDQEAAGYVPEAEGGTETQDQEG